MKRIGLLLFLVIFVSSFKVLAQTKWYVSGNVFGGLNNGQTWADAFTDLQDALDTAVSGDTVWVAVGTYLPSVPHPLGNKDSRSVTFLMQEGVTLFGGFQSGDTSIYQRNFNLNTTTLSGETQGDGDSGNNAYHVVTIANLFSGRLDGFQIILGFADGGGQFDDYGGGILIHSDFDLFYTISGCYINSNTAEFGGGGLAMFSGFHDPTPGAIDLIIFPEIKFVNNVIGYNNLEVNGTDGRAIFIKPNAYNSTILFSAVNSLFEIGSGGDLGVVGIYADNFSAFNSGDLPDLDEFDGSAFLDFSNSIIMTEGFVVGPGFAGADLSLIDDDVANSGAWIASQGLNNITGIDAGLILFTPQLGSPLIDGGDQAFLDPLILGFDADQDFSLSRRIRGSGVDIGPVEFNRPPTVDQGITDQIFNEDEAFIFVVPADAFADLDFDQLTYSATLSTGDPLPAWLSFDPVTESFSGILENPGDAGGIIFDIRVTASDGKPQTAETIFELSFNEINDAPVVQPINDTTIYWGQNLVINTVASDEETVNLVYFDDHLDIVTDPLTGQMTWTPQKDDIGSHDVEITTADDGSLQFGSNVSQKIDTEIFNITVLMKNPIFVDMDATGANNGSSWNNAFTDLHEALQIAVNEDDIWIAEGIYSPGAHVDSTYLIDKDLFIYGGFTGNETLLSQRDVLGNPVVLDGTDINYHVLTIDGAVTALTLDGLIIENGNADGSGGLGTEQGAGIIISGNGQTINIKNSVFRNNFAQNGAGVALNGVSNNETSLYQFNVLYHDNIAGNYGGAIYAKDVINGSFQIYFTNSSLVNNQSFNGGSVLYFAFVSTGIANAGFTNCLFEGNLDTNGNYTGHSPFPNTEFNFQKNIFPDNPLTDHTGTNINIFNANLVDQTIVLDPGFTLPDGSPAINAGDNTFVATPLDLAGNPRIIGGIVDMGAFEAVSAENLAPAVLINEVKTNITNSCDLIEIRASENINVNGYVVKERGSTVITLGDLDLIKDDLLVVHINDGACNTTLSGNEVSKNEYGESMHPQNYDNAYDWYTSYTGLVSTTNVLTLEDDFGQIIDAMVGTNGTSAPAITTQNAYDNVYSVSQWFPGPYIDDINFHLDAVSGLNGLGSLQRFDNHDSNLNLDWASQTESFGELNPGQDPPIVTFNHNLPDSTFQQEHTFEIVFSKLVTQFTQEDMLITNATITSFSGLDTNYNISISATTDGTVQIQVPAAAAFDAINVPNEASEVLEFYFNANEAPSFTPGADPGVLEDTDLVSIPDWATDIVDGDEGQHTVTLLVTDPDNEFVNFEQNPSIGNDGALTFKPVTHAYGGFRFAVIPVDDGPGADPHNNTGDSVFFQINVANVNDRPTFDMVNNLFQVDEDAGLNIFDGEFVNLSGGPNTNYPDGDNIIGYSFQVEEGKEGLFSTLPINNGLTGFRFSPAPNQNGVAVISIRAIDNGGTANGGVDSSDVKTFTINILPVNDPPTFTLSVSDLELNEDFVGTQTVESTLNPVPADEAGQTIVYSLLDQTTFAAVIVNPATGNITIDPVANQFGEQTIRVVANDEQSENNTHTSSFILRVLAVNDAPSMDAFDQSVVVGQSLAYTPDADDVEGDAMTFSFEGQVPPGLVIDGSTGQITWTPSEGDMGDHEVTIKVEDDGNPIESTSVDITISVLPEGVPEIDQGISLQEALEDQSFSFEVPANAFKDDGGVENLTYTAALSDGTDLSETWLNFDGFSFSGLPEQQHTGDWQVRLNATDLDNLSNFLNFTIRVVEVDDAPVAIGDFNNVTALVGQELVVTVNADNIFEDEEEAANLLILSATLEDDSELPDWLSLNAGILRGTPPIVEKGRIYNLKLTATDRSGNTASVFFSLLIADFVAGQPEILNGIPGQSAVEDQAFNFTIADNIFSDPSGNGLTYSVSLSDNSALPAWLAFDPVARSFSGTPNTDNDAGEILVKVTATNSNGSVSALFTITISAVNDQPTVGSGISSFNAIPGEQFSVEFPESLISDEEDGNLPLSISKIPVEDNPTLPAWLSFDQATRTLSGTPPDEDAGMEYTFEICGSDSEGQSVCTTFTLTIDEITAIEDSFGPVVTIYPNPFNGEISIEINNINGGIEGRIMNVGGKIIKKYKWDHISGNFVKTISLNLETGIYLLEIKTESGKIVKRVISN